MDGLDDDLEKLESNLQAFAKRPPPQDGQAEGPETGPEVVTVGADVQRITAEIARARTSVVTLKTEAETHAQRLERYAKDKQRRLQEVKDYNALLVDLEAWLREAQVAVDTEMKLSKKLILKDIRIIEVKLIFMNHRG